MDMAVTSCRLPLSHHGAQEYPLDPAYPSTTLVYEVTTLMPPGPPPFGWPSKALEQARKHNEPLSNPPNIWPIHTHHTTHDEHKHGLINYRDSIETMNKLYIMNRVLKERIQSHTESQGSLNDSEDDLIR